MNFMDFLGENLDFLKKIKAKMKKEIKNRGRKTSVETLL